LQEFLRWLWIEPPDFQIYVWIEMFYLCLNLSDVYHVKPLVYERNQKPGVLCSFRTFIRVVVMKLFPLRASELLHERWRVVENLAWRKSAVILGR
jgi:hypothetical protein